MSTPAKALSLHVTGIVQGVGFRPSVYNLAVELGLSGWVLNASDGVHCVVEGDPAVVAAFPAALEAGAPPMAVIEHVFAEEVEPEGFEGFEIRESAAEEGAMTLVSPDIATCGQCVREFTDPADRRAGYAFTNCTNCGPRFTIIEDVPYDRPLTTMRDFPMCDACAAEYGDPTDRRFHAQPNACFVCGPRLYLNGTDFPESWRWTPEVEVAPRPHRDANAERDRAAEIIERLAEIIAAGGIVAIKGLGGFHLACSAIDDAAVARVRERKHRWGKPLAIMARDIDAARAYCLVDDKEEALLSGAVRPIVLLRRHTSSPFVPAAGAPAPLAEGIAEGLAEIGCMLPYTPLQHLLLEAVGMPLVMTSGNLSEEPIATGNAEALERLDGIADAFLLNDRDIYSRYDDSVVRVVRGIVEPVRRARGYAPHPVALPFRSDVHILAAGPEQKNTFTLVKDGYAFVSQHIGDLENAETLESFEQTLELYKQLFRIEPRIVAHDLHPEYLSTKWAMELDLPRVGVQHHHAHIVSVTAEHGISERVLGVALDGTGYGEDGRIWGGEFLIADWSGYERFAHLRYVPMPGGAAAIRRPARMAVGTLHALGLLEHPGAAPLRSRLADGEERTLLTMVDRGVNTPLTSSMGRLFDTVAAVIGIADDARYEGEAAILLESAADTRQGGTYEFALLPPESPDAPLIVDFASLMCAILDDVAAQIPQGVISARFHRAVTACIVSIGELATQRAGTRYVALAGGVFLNRLVFGETVEQTRLAGLLPLTHVSLPVNDAAVSFGQAVVAWSRRHEV
jgi:hydrogenase maturation protein HypF